MSSPPPPREWQQAPIAGGLPPDDPWPLPPKPRKGKGLALTALLFGIFGTCLGLLPVVGIMALPVAVVGLVFGIIALVGAIRGVRAGRAGAIAGTLLCVLALVLGSFWIVVILNSFKDSRPPMESITGQDTDVILRTDLDVELGQFVTDSDPGKPGKMVVTLRNKSNSSQSFSVEVEAFDANGNRIADDTAFVDILAPGEAAQRDMFVFVTRDRRDAMKKASFKIVAASKYAPVPPPAK